MFTWLENKKFMLNTSLASAVRMKSLLYFYLFKQQMPFLKELKQKAKLARTCPKCNPGASKCKKQFWRRRLISTRELAPSHTYPDLALRAGMGAPPPFLVPVITTIVLAISILNENPDSFSEESWSRLGCLALKTVLQPTRPFPSLFRRV